MINWAFKEWHVAVTALDQGQTVLLLRKGGIREEQGQFRVAARQVLLLPTFEHQNSALLKPEFQGRLDHSAMVKEESTVSFTNWAEITHLFFLDPPTRAYELLPHLIWNQQFVQDRLQWKPEKPLYAMALRVYRLNSPVALPRHSGYGGCRSWVALGQAVTVEGCAPVLTDGAYQQKLTQIFRLLPNQVSA